MKLEKKIHLGVFIYHVTQKWKGAAILSKIEKFEWFCVMKWREAEWRGWEEPLKNPEKSRSIFYESPQT